MNRTPQLVVFAATIFYFAANGHAQEYCTLRNLSPTYSGHFLNISSTKGTFKVYADGKHSGSRWVVLGVKGDKKGKLLKSGAVGEFNGYYLTLKPDGKAVELKKVPNKYSVWRVVKMDSGVVLKNAETLRYLTVGSQKTKVWSTHDIEHSCTRWQID